jgi:hypothetical protein
MLSLCIEKFVDSRLYSYMVSRLIRTSHLERGVPCICPSSGLFLTLFLVRLFNRVASAFSHVNPRSDVLKFDIGGSTSILSPWKRKGYGEGLVDPRVEGDHSELVVEDGEISALDLLRLSPIVINWLEI